MPNDYGPPVKLFYEIMLDDNLSGLEQAKQATDVSRKWEFSHCLMAAIEKGNRNVVPWLLAHGEFGYCRVYSVISCMLPSNQIHHDPIEHALKKGQIAIAKLLIRSGKFDVNLNMLRLAIRLGQDDVVQSLLQTNKYTKDELSSLIDTILASVVPFGEKMLKPFLANQHFDCLALIPHLAKDEEGEALIATILFERPDLAEELKERFPAVYARQRELSMGLIDSPKVTLEQVPTLYSPHFNNVVDSVCTMLGVLTLKDESERRVINPLIV